MLCQKTIKNKKGIVKMTRYGLLSILTNDAEIEMNQALIKAGDVIQKENQALQSDFLLLLKNLCNQIIEFTSKNSYAVKYLQFILLRNQFLNRHYIYEVRIYDEMRQFYDGFELAKYDASFLYKYFDEVWNFLLQKKKR